MKIIENNHYGHIDMQQYTPAIHIQQTLMQHPEIVQYPEGWEDGLSSDEFLLEAKKMLKRKFDDRN